jgi:aminopeptidase N
MRFPLIFFALVILVPRSTFSQPAPREGAKAFTRADTLRGTLSPARACYDVKWYHLDVVVNPDSQSIAGSTTIRFVALGDCSRMQVDLFENMRVKVLSLDGGPPLKFTREAGAIFVTVPRSPDTGTMHDLVVAYEGKPRVAVNPPWDGGFIWRKDDAGSPWVAVACQGTGASLWWPNKDHQSDEPDSMLISVTVPPGLEDVSNGRLRSVTRLPGGWSRYVWGVTYPINNYDVTVNIGKFAHIVDAYHGETSLTLDYYVLPNHLEQAKKQFAQVTSMLACFEKDFGPYPFARDGYKLVESPHLGMEHQTAVAYGNGFKQGYRGTSASRYGVMFDFIIIHESAHEWWGNSVTAKDIADMWIHESFGAHAEALYVECRFGRDAMLDYVNSKRTQVANRTPILGVPNVNNEGSGDMYPKGSLMLHTLRGMMDNDSLWFAVLRGLHERFKYTTVTTEDVVGYINSATGTDYTPFFDQYLRHASIPRLDVTIRVKGTGATARYRWKADEEKLNMPVRVTTSGGTFAFIRPTTSWQTMDLGALDPKDFRVDEQWFYVDTQIRTLYQDPE